MSKEVMGIITSNGYNSDIYGWLTIKHVDIDRVYAELNTNKVTIDLSSYIEPDKTLDDIIGISVNAGINELIDSPLSLIYPSCLFGKKYIFTDGIGAIMGDYMCSKYSMLFNVTIKLYETKTLEIFINPQLYTDLNNIITPYRVSCLGLRIYYR